MSTSAWVTPRRKNDSTEYLSAIMGGVETSGVQLVAVCNHTFMPPHTGVGRVSQLHLLLLVCARRCCSRAPSSTLHLKLWIQAHCMLTCWRKNSVVSKFCWHWMDLQSVQSLFEQLVSVNAPLIDGEVLICGGRCIFDVHLCVSVWAHTIFEHLVHKPTHSKL